MASLRSDPSRRSEMGILILKYCLISGPYPGFFMGEGGAYLMNRDQIINV